MAESHERNESSTEDDQHDVSCFDSTLALNVSKQVLDAFQKWILYRLFLQ